MVIEKTVGGSNGYMASAGLWIANVKWATCNLLAASNGSTVAIDQKVIRTITAPANGPIQLQGVFHPSDTGAVTFQVTCYDPAYGATAESLSLIVLAVGLQP